jgi:hypothetical protein
MPYGNATVRCSGKKLMIEIDLPPHGELSLSGRAENLVDPRSWIDFEDSEGPIGVKLTVCRLRIATVVEGDVSTSESRMAMGRLFDPSRSLTA